MVRVSKRFVAGTGSCLATAAALTHVEVRVDAGESLAVVGPSGAGKTTLLLCASGLLPPDEGTILWFGDPHRAIALDRVRLHYHRASLADSAAPRPAVHLVDLGDVEAARTRAWIASRVGAGDSVVVAVRDAALGRRLAGRIVALRDGRVAPSEAARSRVAEHVFVDRPLRHA